MKPFGTISALASIVNAAVCYAAPVPSKSWWRAALAIAVPPSPTSEIIEVIGAPGSHRERVRWRCAATDKVADFPIRNDFLFVGADPATQWLRDCGIALDAKGFVRTGSDDRRGRPLPLESNVPGVFAVGDVRSDSVSG
jgi:thioredoxin reductase